jgi:hypothetical protein
VAQVAATPGEIAWMAALPCGLLLLAAVVLLGAPLGHALLEPPDVHWWPFWGPRLGHLPEPAEHADFAFALVAPVALAGVVALAVRRRLRVGQTAVDVLVWTNGALLVAFLVACMVVQSTRTFGYPYGTVDFRRVYFTPPTLAVALALALGTAAVLHHDTLVAALGRWTAESPGRRRAALLVAALATVAWILPGVETDGSAGLANGLTWVNIPFWLEEPFAVLDGRLPLVHFHAQYSQLLPYLTAGPMALFGASLGLYTALLVTLTGLGMLAVYALLRRVVGRSLPALAIYLPVLATGFFTEEGPLANRHGPVTLLSMFPMRYAGAYLVAWLTARHLDGSAPRRFGLLAFFSGIVLCNNIDFGVPAFGAMLAAVALTRWPDSWAAARRLALEGGLGLLGAILLAALVPLAVGGSLPHPGWLFTFTRLYGVDGFGAMPMPKLGFHLAIYATFAAAIVVAAVRASAHAEDRLLTAMLAWAGVFGLGASPYYVGRSLPEVLISMFSAWALALALLFVVVARALARRPARRPTLPELTVLMGFGIAVCSLAQTPLPWTQINRISTRSAQPIYAHTATERFVARRTTRGEHVAILTPLGHRIAYDLGLVNVSPYSELQVMLVREQLQETLDDVRAAHARKLFVPVQTLYEEPYEAIVHAGFRLVARGTQQENVIELVDARWRAGRAGTR